MRTDNKKFKTLRDNSKFSRRGSSRIKQREQKLREKRITESMQQKLQRQRESEIRKDTITQRGYRNISNQSLQKVVLERNATGINANIVNTKRLTEIQKSKNVKIIMRGETSEDAGHKHRWSLYEDGILIIHEAKHPKDARIKHNHSWKGSHKSGYMSYNKSSCYRDNASDPQSCQSLYGLEGAPTHKHIIKFTI